MILVTGSLAFDHILNFPGKFGDHILPDKIHNLNVSFLVDEMRKSFGGTAGNIAYSLSLLGVRTGILGCVGTDFSPYRELLEGNEVETKYIREVAKFYTSTAFGMCDAGDNTIWGFYTGADALSDNLSLLDVRDKIDFGIIAPQNPRAMLRFAKEYRKLGIGYLFDPGMQLPWLLKSDLEEGIAGARIVIGNDYEIDVMEKKMEIDDLNTFAKEGKIIITTLGEKGSRVAYRDEIIFAKAAGVKSVSDPAGAGDAYRAGFVAGYLRQLPITVCAQMGSVAAAYTVEKYGTTTHRYTLAQFMRRYKENFKEEIKL